MLATLLTVLIFASWLYWLVALILVYDFFRSRPAAQASFTPPVSLLKPVKGVDYQAYQNFAAFCQQDYPDYEVLFGVTDPSDPIIPVIERLRRDSPAHTIRVIIGGTFGANRKASLLHHLANEAQHDILVASDSDMRAAPDYLRRVVAPLADEQVGLTTCLYLAEAPLTLTAGLEALQMGATFLPSVLVARKFLDMRFAMGASVALRHRDLARLGGFAVLADYLADDYQLVARIAALGLKVRLSDYVMTCMLGATSFREQWDREVRWMRCSHVSRPREYPGLLLSFSTPLSAVLIMVNGLGPATLRILMISLLLRLIVALFVSLRTGDRHTLAWLPWLPVRDLLSAATWCVGGLGRRIAWRGETFVLQDDGRMQPAHDLAAQPAEDGQRHRRFRWLRP